MNERKRGRVNIYKSIIVIIIETVEYNVSVRFFTSCGEPESSKNVVLKGTRKEKYRTTCITVLNVGKGNGRIETRKKNRKRGGKKK